MSSVSPSLFRLYLENNQRAWLLVETTQLAYLEL